VAAGYGRELHDGFNLGGLLTARREC
jgi:hypothetical protein